MSLSMAGKASTIYLIKTAIVMAIVIVSGLTIYYLSPLILNSPVVFLKIKSDSMLPIINTGDTVVIGKLGSNKAIDSYIGKIIAFYDPVIGEIIVHRVIGKNGECLITKGDNSQTIDFFNPCPNYILGQKLLIFKI